LRQAQKAKEQEQKIKQMIKRATQPIIRKNGRPLNKREIPQKVLKKNQKQIDLAMIEKERIEQILYGSDS
jgi:hypothetical protein